MTISVIGTEKDKTGAIVTISLANPLGGSPVVPVFLKNYAQLINDNHAHPILVGTNKSKSIYALIDNQIVGHIVFDIQDDIFKTTWIVFGVVDLNYRRRGIYLILNKFLESVAKQMGSQKIASFVHVNNTSMLELSEAVGRKKVFYRVEKELK